MRTRKTSGKSKSINGNGYRSSRSKAVKKTAQKIGQRARIRNSAKKRMPKK